MAFTIMSPIRDTCECTRSEASNEVACGIRSYATTSPKDYNGV